MGSIKTHPWDSAAHLRTDEDRLLYLNACLQEDDTALIVHALSLIARTQGMAQLAQDSGIPEERLREVFSGERNPEFVTVMKVIVALGFRLHVERSTH